MLLLAPAMLLLTALAMLHGRWVVLLLHEAFLLVLTLILFSPALKNCLSVFSVCLVSYRESAIFPSHPPTSGKIEVWETTTLPSLPR